MLEKVLFHQLDLNMEDLFSEIDRGLSLTREGIEIEKGDRAVIITDTVGFIRELPDDLLGAFRATLDELKDAHLLLHLVDISSPRFEQHMDSVDKIITELGIDHIDRMLVFNKTDKCGEESVRILCKRYNACAVSAIHPETLLPLLTTMEKRLFIH